MPPLFEVPVSAAGLLLAAASVVAGAPWFADGLRCLRARRALAGVRPESFAAAPRGLAELRGRVELESPLFSPLSARPCAGYVLEVRGVGTRIGGEVSEVRPFRLADGEVRARIEAATVAWQLGVTAEREVAAGASIPERIRALIDRHPDLRWLRAQGGALRLVERALCSGVECHVLGELRQMRVSSDRSEVVTARTGTDDGFTSSTVRTVEVSVSSRVIASDLLDRLVIADRDVDVTRLAPAAWRTSGALLGPSLCLAGLVYLAHAADVLLAGRLG